ncbi:hypothetical protein F4777DRAFT_52257 [Nemania sp. FL0916]|nr:hypothetical protein F4777DRAFT_52257 [Nemania sp. FL0916]
MDFLDELESLADAAMQQLEQPEHDDIKRWQNLFGFTYSQALKEILDHRLNLARPTVSESHWEMVRAEKEAVGYNKEAYEFSSTFKAPSSSEAHAVDSNRRYLLRLEDPLDNLAAVKAAAQLNEDPQVYYGTDDDEKPATFCIVSAAAKTNILAYLSGIKSCFQPTFVPYSVASKELSLTSAYPTLGINATLPHHRPSSLEDPRLFPSQQEYPVWYFFYGTLADPAVLGRLLGIEPSYKDAHVFGGSLITWGGKYNGLVNKPKGCVHGSAFLVKDKEQEEILQCYETSNYEVVRCEIHTADETIRGLTFRFITSF